MNLLSQPGEASQVWRNKIRSDPQIYMFVAIVPEYASVLHLSELIPEKSGECVQSIPLREYSSQRYLRQEILPEIFSSINWTCPRYISFARFKMSALFFSRSWSSLETRR